jgi:hypothetical protein
MKKILTLSFLICFLTLSFAQTEGISYQAVIIAPDDFELPGVDSEGNYLPNTEIDIRFSLLRQENLPDPSGFVEQHTVETDEFGRINLIIGSINFNAFQTIAWDGSTKFLKVEINFNDGNGFVEISRERLTFLPYAYHRNITATGTLDVEGNTHLNGELLVENPTTLNSSLLVDGENPTDLTGSLTVGGITDLNNALNVNEGSPTNLSGSLTVTGNSALDGTLDVIGLTTLNDLIVNGEASFGDLSATNLKVTDSTRLEGGLSISTGSLVRIKRTFTEQLVNSEPDIEDHAVLIEGTRQGLAIQVNDSRNNLRNFITFYDEERDLPWGRIEGEIPDEFGNNADYTFDQRALAYDIADGSLDALFAGADIYAAVTGTVMAFSSSTPCAGIGACVTAPIPSMIFKYTTESVVVTIQAITAAGALTFAILNKTTYDNNKDEYQGVTYASGAGDYAEFLLREDINEKMTYGDIVGVKGGKITKNTENAERVMVVSYKPIVLGNMPRENREHEYEKVAFMGQVPVKVFGKVNKGDYIIPSGKNNGIGVAISPNKITLKDINSIVGTAWNESQEVLGLNLINVAVGINTNDNNHIVEALEQTVTKQQVEIDYLKEKINEILEALSDKDTNENIQITHTDDISSNEEHNQRKFEVVESAETDIIYFEITRTDLEKALVSAEDAMKESGLYEANKAVWERLKTDPKFKNDFIDKLEAKLQKQMHYHQEIDKGARH